MMIFKKTFQVFSACNKILSPESMGKIWHVGARNVYRWGADPDYTEGLCRNPLDRLITTLERAQEIGREDVVEGVLSYIANLLGYDVSPKSESVKSDKQSSTLELMDVNSALGKIASQLQEFLEDEHLDSKEKESLVSSAAVLVRQAMELKDALASGKK